MGAGGIRIDGTMGAFGFKGDDGNAMPLGMSSSCQVHSGTDDFVYEKNDDCEPWMRTGSTLKAYDALVSDQIVDFDLTYPVYFESEGSVEFLFRFDSHEEYGQTNGLFKFFIDGDLQKEWGSNGAVEWHPFEVTGIPEGPHTLVWRYTKINIIPDTEFMDAEI